MRVNYPTPTSAIARPAVASSSLSLPTGPLTRERAVDLLARSVWALAIELGHAAGWAQSDWRAPDFNPGYLLDVFLRADLADNFPLPGSPNLDGGGSGARKVAPDGSPGIPHAWIRWMERTEDVRVVVREGSPTSLALAQCWMEQYAPIEWELYRAHVLAGVSIAALAVQYERSIKSIQTLVRRARGLLLARISYFTGEATYDELRALVAMVRTPEPEPAPAKPEQDAQASATRDDA